MALLHILLRLTAGTGVTLAAAHFNHRLRPAADRDEQFVRGLSLFSMIVFRQRLCYT